MKRSTFLKGIFTILTMAIGFTNLVAQITPPTTSPAAPPASPSAVAKGKLKDGANITITYSSPSVKGRKIWGDLVPFDKVWRAGANDATQIETDKDLTLEGKKLPAGKYSIYMVPTENDWVIIFSSQTGQPGMNHDGSTTLDMTKKVMSVLGKPRKSKTMNESLVYTITEKGFVLSWENLDVSVTMK
jgi:hypothetical protein